MSASLLRTTLSRSTRTSYPKVLASSSLPVSRYLQRRSIVILKDHVYFGRATASGPGRAGHVTSDSNGDASLELDMTPPKAFGGTGNGHNPEQLLAMAYSSCFLGALQLCASKAGKPHVADNALVHVRAYLGHPVPTLAEEGGPATGPGMAGFGLKVDIHVEGVEDDGIIQAAHYTCPFSNAFREGIEVRVTKA